MSDQPDPDLTDDDVLLGLLGSVLDEAEPIPDGLAETVADATFDVRRLDAVLAELVHDSELSASGTRGDDFARNLVFAQNGVELELEIAVEGGTVHGLVQPPNTICEIETPTGTQPVGVDAAGRFDTVIVARRFRVIMAPATGSRIATPWIFG